MAVNVIELLAVLPVLRLRQAVLRQTAVCALHEQDTLCKLEEKFENTNFGLEIKLMEC
jgi:hypothetical protein